MTRFNSIQIQPPLTAVLVDHVDENVHLAQLETLVVVAEQPQHLLEAAFASRLQDLNRSTVRSSQFGRAAAARPRANVLAVGKDGDRPEFVVERRTRRTQDGVQQSFVRVINSNRWLK